MKFVSSILCAAVLAFAMVIATPQPAAAQIPDCSPYLLLNMMNGQSHSDEVLEEVQNAFRATCPYNMVEQAFHDYSAYLGFWGFLACDTTCRWNWWWGYFASKLGL